MLITNFSSGEISRKLSGRTDIQQYYQGVSRLVNFDIIPTGGIERRKGNERIAKLDGNCRIIPFIVDADTNFILVFYPGEIHIFENGFKKSYTIETTYTMQQIKELHYAQNYDQMIFVQREHTPFMLKYDMSTSLITGSSMQFDFIPNVELDDDFGWVIIAGTTEPEKVTVASGKLAFKDKDGKTVVTGDEAYCIHMGKLKKYDTTLNAWKIEGDDPDIDNEVFTTENKYPACCTFFNNRLFFASTNLSPQKVWASCTPDTKETRYNKFATYQKYVTVNKVVKDADIHVFTGNILVADIDTVNHRTTLTSLTQDFTEEGLLSKDITEYYVSDSDFIPVGTKVLSVTSSTMVIDSELTTVTEDKKNIVFTIQLWRDSSAASADDYEYQITYNNMTTSDCSFNFELASDQNDAIRFIGASKYMTIGTESSVWHVPNTVSALNIAVEMSGRYGSDRIQGHAVGNAMIYFSQGNCGIRETYYDNNAEAFTTNNIALLADQMLTESPVVDFDFITNPYNRLVLTREDGLIVTMLYDKTNGIMGWNRNKHAVGKYVSCAVTRGQAQSDISYYVVKTGEGSESEYFLERYDENKAIYLDAYSQVTDLESLENYDDAVYIDANGNELTEDEAQTLLEESKTVYVGYKFESLLSSMPVIAGDPTSKKRITNLLIRFLDSYMPDLVCESSVEHFNDVVCPYSGIKSIVFAGSSDRDVSFTVSFSESKPCSILSVNALLA